MQIPFHHYSYIHIHVLLLFLLLVFVVSLLALLRFEGETLLTTDCARAWVNIVNETLNLEVRRFRLVSNVLAVHFFGRVNLSVCHSNVRVGVSRFFVCVLVCVSRLHVVTSTVAEVVCNHGFHWGWGSVSSAKSEGFTGKVGGLALYDSEGNASVVGSAEQVLFRSGDGFSLEGHFVKFFEVAWVLTSDCRALVDPPVSNDLVGGFTVGQQVVLSESELVGGQIACEWLCFANVVLH